MKDCLGREITAGCDVIYPIRKSYTVNMHVMKVTGTDNGHLYGFNSAGRKISLKNVENVCILAPLKPE